MDASVGYDAQSLEQNLEGLEEIAAGAESGGGGLGGEGREDEEGGLGLHDAASGSSGAQQPERTSEDADLLLDDDDLQRIAADTASDSASADSASASASDGPSASTSSAELLEAHALLESCVRKGEWSKALRAMRALSAAEPKPDRYAYALALLACQRLGAWQVAAELLNEAEESELTPTASMYARAIATCAASARWQEATALLARMAATASSPLSAYPYTLVMRASAAAGQWGHAASIHEAMVNAGTQPTAKSVEALFGALAKAPRGSGAEDRILALRAQATSLGIPASVGVSAVLRAMGEKKDARGALALLSQMRREASTEAAPRSEPSSDAESSEPGFERGPARLRPLSASIYTAVISVCARANRYQDARRVYSQLLSDGAQPTEFTLATMIGACAQASDWRAAIALFDQIERDFADPVPSGRDSPSVRARLYAYGGALRACASSGEHERVLDLFVRIKDAGLVPSMFCYQQAILACERAGSVRLARDLLDEMKPNGLQPNIFVFTAAVQVCASRGAFNAALGLLDRMHSEGPKPTTVTYNVLLRGAVALGQLEVASKVLSQMPQLGAQPDSFSYSTVINGYAAESQVPEALKWIRKMPPALLTPQVYHGLISALCASGNTKKAMEQLDAMRKAGMTPAPQTMRLLLEQYGGGESPFSD